VLGQVNKVSIGSGVIYLGGDFNIVATHTRHNIAALDAVSGIPTEWGPQCEQQGQQAARGR
jgi:hypothetical protein